MDIAEYPDLGEREKTILRYIAKAGREVKSKELIERFPEYKRDSLYTGLAVLQKKGMIQKKGLVCPPAMFFCPASLNTSSDANKEKQVFMDIVHQPRKKAEKHLISVGKASCHDVHAKGIGGDNIL